MWKLKLSLELANGRQTSFVTYVDFEDSEDLEDQIVAVEAGLERLSSVCQSFRDQIVLLEHEEWDILWHDLEITEISFETEEDEIVDSLLAPWESEDQFLLEEELLNTSPYLECIPEEPTWKQLGDAEILEALRPLVEEEIKRIHYSILSQSDPGDEHQEPDILGELAQTAYDETKCPCGCTDNTVKASVKAYCNGEEIPVKFNLAEYSYDPIDLLTDEEKEEIQLSVQAEGLNYFLYSTNEWEQRPSEIQKKVKEFARLGKELENLIENL